jgi:signal transduction histidine kinase
MIEALHDGVVRDEETISRYYRTIHGDIIALNTLIDDLFELAQLEAGGLRLNYEEQSLSDLVSDTLESFRAVATAKGVALEGAVAHGVDPVTISAAKISRVLNNLVANAIQYTPEGGSVTVKARRQNGTVRVAVEDSGPGFMDEDLPRVFEQFYRGEQARSRRTGGSGLGLAIAQAIVAAHGGQIWASNRVRGGARIEFTLPDAHQHTNDG